MFAAWDKVTRMHARKREVFMLSFCLCFWLCAAEQTSVKEGE
jgi:hypothetical protein